MDAKNCRTIYGGLILESYLLIILNVVVFTMLQTVFLELILPNLMKPAQKIFYGIVEECAANIDNDAVEGEKWRGAIKINAIWAVLQGLVSLVIIVFTWLQLDRSVSSWQQYENFYGLILNSAVLNSLISMSSLTSFIQYAGRKGFKLLPGTKSTRNPYFILLAALYLPIVLVVLPSLFTHMIPGMIVYVWVMMIVLLCTVYGVFAVVQRIEDLFGMEYSFGILDEHYDEDFLRAVIGDNMFSPAGKLRYQFIWAGFRLCFHFSFLSLFNYMHFFYLLSSSGGVPPNDYLGVITDDYALRTQTFCLYEHYKDDYRNMIIFFSWL
jgi:hypothetical protein